ncbi:Uncharacterised protein [Streptococcus pneumoniae]|nr:Uncharacterised protein [Streptococcus pneumoniae]CIQ96065.1 Uncharacterised protein [Streptococcus pneumoniae]CIT19771.1 Uncharacterised protein [Streptococcus pneumoniae]CIW33621.1 Uncharacterised protein [Streptococcus pneumoniae]CJH16613.1 Uncharacterised protein [Streptococcus pneumoniae]
MIWDKKYRSTSYQKHFFVFPHSINHLVQYFKNNILTEKMIFNLSAHLIVFENIKQYF